METCKEKFPQYADQAKTWPGGKSPFKKLLLRKIAEFCNDPEVSACLQGRVGLARCRRPPRSTFGDRTSLGHLHLINILQ